MIRSMVLVGSALHVVTCLLLFSSFIAHHELWVTEHLTSTSVELGRFRDAANIRVLVDLPPGGDERPMLPRQPHAGPPQGFNQNAPPDPKEQYDAVNDHAESTRQNSPPETARHVAEDPAGGGVESHHAPGQDGIGAAVPKDDRGASQEGLVDLGATAEQVLNADAMVLAGDGILDVFVVPHTHCDPGWLFTMEEYYKRDVKNILTTVVRALKADSARRFSWVEVSFLERWWRDQNEEMKRDFRDLVRNGQLELLMGGWVSSDEACTNYIQVVHQMAEGHRWLQREVLSSANPRIGWQIDPFGLSRAYPSMFSQMCFDANVAWRISEPEMRSYMPKKEVEFVWRGSESIGSASDLLMHLLPWGYEEFLFEGNAAKSTMRDVNKLIRKQGARMLANNFLDRAKNYQSSNILMWPWGHDFRFKDANKMFSNMDALIAKINENPSEFGVRVRYATPSEYFDALHSESLHFPVKSKDFFPYWAGPVNWWTGYYTSRPLFKRRLRNTDATQRAAEALHVLGRAYDHHGADWDGMFTKLESLRHVQGVMQHHDAITGTMKEAVLQDYNAMLDRAVPPAVNVMEQSLSALLDIRHTGLSAIDHEEKTLVNVGSSVVVYNSLPWTSVQFVEVLVEDAFVSVSFEEDGAIQSAEMQLMPLWAPSSKIGKLSETHSTQYRLLFKASVPPLGSRAFFLEHSEVPGGAGVTVYVEKHTALRGLEDAGFEVLPLSDAPMVMDNGIIRAEFAADGSLKGVTDHETANSLSLSHSYWTYSGDKDWQNHYTFKNTAPARKMQHEGIGRQVIGPFVSEVSTFSTEIATQTIRIYDGEGMLEVEDEVGPPSNGMEIVVRFKTSVPSDVNFFTDDNGLETVCRAREVNDPKVLLPGNFYPSVYAAGLMRSCGEAAEFVVVQDRPHAVTSPASGELEVLLHRSTLQTLGNGEAMAEKYKVTVRSWLLFSQRDLKSRYKRAMQLNFPPLLFSVPMDQAAWFRSNALAVFEPLRRDFDDNVFLMSLQQYEHGSAVATVRVNHIIPAGEVWLHPLNERTSIELSSLFNDLELSDIDERTLSLSGRAEDCRRHHWHDIGEVQHQAMFGSMVARDSDEVDASSGARVELDPLHIRSFLANLRRSR